MSKTKLEIFPINEKQTKYIFRKRGEFRKLETLGEGTFGKVLLVEQKDASNPIVCKKYAIKVSKRFKVIEAEKPKIQTKNQIQAEMTPLEKTKEDDQDPKPEPQQEQTFNDHPRELNFIEIRELSIMNKLNHPNLMSILDFKIQKNEVWILMDYLPIDLGKFVRNHRKDQNQYVPEIINEDFLRNISLQIIRGINNMHMNRFMHRDIKLENILYDPLKKLIRVSDFGLSRHFGFEKDAQFTDVGTDPYKPPDVILGNTYYFISFDVWSIGCILAEIAIGRHLFGGSDKIEVLKNIYEIFGSLDDSILPGCQDWKNYDLIKNLPLKQGIGIKNYLKEKSIINFKDEKFFDLIEKMLILDPVKRILLEKCLIHPWFTDFPNDNL